MVIDIRARREILKSRWLARVVSGNLITYTKKFSSLTQMLISHGKITSQKAEKVVHSVIKVLAPFPFTYPLYHIAVKTLPCVEY